METITFMYITRSFVVYKTVLFNYRHTDQCLILFGLLSNARSNAGIINVKDVYLLYGTLLIAHFCVNEYLVAFVAFKGCYN